MPGKEEMKATNICFPNHEVIDYERYQTIINLKISKGHIPTNLTEESNEYRILLNSRGENIPNDIEKEIRIQYYLTIKERLEIAINADKLFNIKFSPPYFRKFILSKYICYQMWTIGQKEFEIEWGIRPLSSEWYSEYKVKPMFLENVTLLHIVMSPINQAPFIEFFLNPVNTNFEWNRTVKYVSTANSFKVKKLEWPYVDNCINYINLDFKDKRDAINSCISKKTITAFGRIARFKEFNNETAVNYPMIYPLWLKNISTSLQFSNECKNLYHQENCEHETIFTKTMSVEEKLDFFYFYQSMSESPSYDIESQPKIENVDFVTYIFGAFGIWFGFCFISFNPLIQCYESKERRECRKMIQIGIERKKKQAKRKERITNLIQCVANLSHRFDKPSRLGRNVFAHHIK